MLVLFLVHLAVAEVLDLKTRQLLETLEPPTGKHTDLISVAAPIPAELKPFPVQQKNDGDWVVNAFLQVDPGEFNQSDLAGLQLQFKGQFEDIYSVAIPLSRISELAQVKGIKWVELSRKAQFRLDVSRPEIAADRVHQQVTELGKAFTGKGVIVGIVDSGIDFQHPDFLKTDGATRILYLWDQNGSGNSPAGYSYGVEWTASQINNRQTTHQDVVGHGTHVTGIAAGNGRGFADKRYTGIAPEADLIVVATSSWTTDISDGIQYIFKKAQLLNRPAVVNLSIGSQEGPHDGTSLFDAALENLVGEGKIVVGAAGNEGSKYIHLNKTMANDSVFTCFARSTDGIDQYYYIDLWGKTGSNLAVAALAVDPNNKAIKFYVAANKKNIKKHFIVNSDTVATLWLGYETSALNNHPHYNFLFDFRSAVNHYDWYIRVSGNGMFDAWTENNPTGIHFKPAKPASFPHASGLYLSGNNNSSIGEIGGTSKKIITVGAYTSKNEWTNYQDYTYQLSPLPILGTLANFSSLGPTRDGRMKPDLSAPGNMVAAPLSRAIPAGSIHEARLVYLPQAPKYNNGYYCLEGTSMSAPHVTGVVALMLEANANLAPEDVKVLLERNTRHDQYTTNTANNSWGAGKVDAYYSVKNAASYTGVSHAPRVVPGAFRLLGNFPNPFNAATIIQFELPEASPVKIHVFDCLGREVREVVEQNLPAGQHSYRFDATQLSTGIYFCQIEMNRQLTLTQKMVLVK
jgi:subtilisin family serine protease